ncbi:hypothetical protein JCM11491_003854 [Sporobolomyces phaffii]
MPTEAPSANAPAGGRCVVCGTQTAFRCSTCSAAGLDWMYFCSTKHQKLVWRGHKRVCGKVPFEWPLLTRAEAKEAWDARDIHLTIKESVLSVLEVFRSGFGPQADDWTDAKLVVLYKTFIENTNDPTGSEIRAWFHGIRYKVRICETDIAPLTAKDVQKFIDPIGFACWLEASVGPDGLSTLEGTSLYSVAQHRVVLLAAAIAARFDAGAPDNEVNAPTHLLSSIRDLCDQEISKTHPEIARRIQDELLPLAGTFFEAGLIDHTVPSI